MPDDNRPPRHDRLPIKVIMPKQGVERKVSGGGAAPTPFRTVDAKYRSRLSNQVAALRSLVLPQSRRTGASPVRVKLIAKAVAKTHRPDSVFSPQSCPIIGGGRLGELFIKATPEGLDQLTETIEHDRSDRIMKELSCIETIEPITPVYRRGGLDARDLLRRSPRGKDGFITRVRLFNLGPDTHQPKLLEDFRSTCRKRDIRVAAGGYSLSSFTYEVECRNVEDINALSLTIGVRSISHMPLIRTIRPRMLNQRPLPKLPTRDDSVGDFPVVVVVDTGVSDEIPEFATWIVGRDSQVAPEYRNTDHGSFVAGLICWGSDLNPTVTGIDKNPCGVFDLQVIPNSDPEKGETLALLESEFLVSLEAALQQHANKYKVWNLSLGTDSVCLLDEFSALAEELDNLQEKYEVSFVISAGNYETPPLLDYPRTPAQLDAGRITVPADSVLGITVGGVSHVDYKKEGPKEHYPSGFSAMARDRITLSSLMWFTTEVHVRPTSHTLQASGRSAVPAPLRTWARVLPLLWYPAHLLRFITRSLRRRHLCMARALLTHHARDPRSSNRVPDGDENFFGFGLPAPVPSCLECTPHNSTLVFDDVLRPGYFLEWNDFPYPPSLYRGRENISAKSG